MQITKEETFQDDTKSFKYIYSLKDENGELLSYAEVTPCHDTETYDLSWMETMGDNQKKGYMQRLLKHVSEDLSLKMPDGYYLTAQPINAHATRLLSQNFGQVRTECRFCNVDFSQGNPQHECSTFSKPYYKREYARAKLGAVQARRDSLAELNKDLISEFIS